MKRDVIALYLAGRDPRVPWYVKMAAIAVAAYALSPIDLIPDVIPVLGHLDDVILVPLGIWLVVKLVPPPLMVEFREAAVRGFTRRPVTRWGAVFIVALWLVAMASIIAWVLNNRWPLCSSSLGGRRIQIPVDRQ